MSRSPVPRSPLWLLLFSFPTALVTVAWLGAPVPAFRDTIIRGAMLQGLPVATVAVCLVVLAIISFVFAAGEQTGARVFAVGLIVLVLAVLANVVGIAPVMFAGCSLGGL